MFSFSPSLCNMGDGADYIARLGELRDIAYVLNPVVSVFLLF